MLSLYIQTAKTIDSLPVSTELIMDSLKSCRALKSNLKKMNVKELHIAFQTELESHNRKDIVEDILKRYYRLIKGIERESAINFTMSKDKIVKESAQQKLDYKATTHKAFQTS